MGRTPPSLADQIPKPATLRDPESLATATRRAPTLQDPESLLEDDEYPMGSPMGSPLVGDKFYGDDAFPGENEDPVQAGHPDDSLEDGPGIKDRRRPKKPRRKIPKSPHSPQIVLLIHKISFMKFSNH